MSNDDPIFKISSTYCLKSILSYIEYNTTLKIVKYNKRIQKKLDINLKDYSLDYELKEQEKTTSNYSRIYQTFQIINIWIALFLYFYQIFYAGFYLRFEPYDNKKEIENIEKYFQKSFGKSKIYHKI